MHVQILIFVSILFRSVTPSQCEDDWVFVNLKKGPHCWKLFNFTNIDSGFSAVENTCEHHGAEIVEVQNKAEKMLFSDIANRVQDPVLFCYKSYQRSLDQFKNVDYEESPEYLKNLNKNGKIQLSRGIEIGDEISLTFSMKIQLPINDHSMEVLQSAIIIGRKSDKSHSIYFNCTFNNNRCELGNFGRDAGVEFLLYGTNLESQLTAEYFGKISFQFSDKFIRVWNHNMSISPEYSYIGMDEITITNLLVNSIEHTTNCLGEDYYGFNRVSSQSHSSPILMRRSESSSAYPRFLGHEVKLSLPEDRFNYYDILGKNPVLYLIRSLHIYNKTKQSKAKRGMAILFRLSSKGPKKYIFKIDMNSTHLCIDYKNGKGTREYVYTNFTLDKMLSFKIGARLFTDVRIFTESLNSTHMSVTAKVVSTTINQRVELQAVMPIKDFDEIHLKSKEEKFYEFTTQPMDEVIITTCNYKNNKNEIYDQTVPYRSHCLTKRMIACEIEAPNTYEEIILDEPKEESVWGQQEVDINVVSENDKGRKPNKHIDALHAMTEDVDIPNADIFEWTIIALISFSAVLFATIFILNIIRCGL